MTQLSSVARFGSWNFDPASGFLRVNMRVLEAGVMGYTREELGDIVPPEITDDIIYLCVKPEELNEPHALESLEGMPLTANRHIDMTVVNSESRVGNIAGAPRVDGPYLTAKGLITDQSAIDAVTQKKLQETSAQYDMVIIWEPGIYQGVPYHGLQSALRYNHVALLPEGGGRGGNGVRILNSTQTEPNQEGDNMAGNDTGFTMVTIGSVPVRVANEDAAKAAQAMDEDKSKAVSMNTEGFEKQLTEIGNQLEGAVKERDEAQGKVAELEKQLEEMKAQIEAMMSPQAVEEKAEAMNQEREEAAQVMNCKTLPDDIKKLSGHDLRVAAVNTARISNKQPELTEDEAKNEGFVQGVFSTMAKARNVSSIPAGAPAGSAAVVTTDAAARNALPAKDGGYSANDRIKKLYGAPREEQPPAASAQQ